MSVAGRVGVWLICLAASVPVGDLLARIIFRCTVSQSN